MFMRVYLIAIFVFSSFIVPLLRTLPAHAQQTNSVEAQDPQSVLLKAANFEEEINPNPTMSGISIIGVVAQAGMLTTAPRLWTRVPKQWAGQSICMKTKSVDGVYSAQSPYTLPNSLSKSGLFELQFPTEKKDILSNYAPNHIAIRIFLGTCNGKPEAYAPSFWNVIPTAVFKTVSIFANTNGAQVAQVFLYDKPLLEPQRCKQVTADRVRSFDFICTVSIDLLSGPAPRLSIMAGRYGRYNKLADVTLRLVP